MIGRSALFIPASSPGMINAAIMLEADTLIFDLEDAVSISEKDAARDLLGRALYMLEKKNVIVRINSLASHFWKDDINLVLHSKAQGILLPKATPADVKYVTEILRKNKPDIMLIPLIETARAVEEIIDIIKSSPLVCGILFGAEDYCLSMGIKRTKESNEISYARARLANATKAFGIEAIDTPYTDAEDLEGLEQDAIMAKSLGYTGKAAINPRQINTINKVFSMQQKEIEQALRIIRAMEKAELSGKGVFQLDGQMIDAPIVERARKVIERAQIWGEINC